MVGRNGNGIEQWSNVHDYIASFYPTLRQMPYCSALQDGAFTKTQTLAAEVVEIYRAFRTRDTIKSLYRQRLDAGLKASDIDTDTHAQIVEVIEDEGETHEHVDHLDMRLQIFRSVGITRKSRLTPNSTLDRINAEWLDVIRAGNLFTTMCVFAAIEDWYAPISG